ncbi:hypothetical protein ABN085_18710 [Morganella morganii]|uniref:hypothetical protein n=1 Tax=Morganella morganii TaxID=582 RepID=UPI0032DBEB8B
MNTINSLAIKNKYHCKSKIKKLYLLILFSIFSSSSYGSMISGGNHKLTYGWNYIGHLYFKSSLTMQGSNGETQCQDKGYWFTDYSGWSITLNDTLSKSSDGIATGAKSAQGDVILVYRGGLVQGENLNSTCNVTAIPPGTWNSSGQYSISPKMAEWENQWKGGITTKKGRDYYRWQKSGKTITSTVNSDIYIYIGPNAVVGKTYQLKPSYLVMSEHGVNQVMNMLTGEMNITVKAPRICTVKTENTINFPPIDITNMATGKALANKTGNFTINCDDATNAPVNIEIQGRRGMYPYSMALTMTDGSNAPAEINGFIGSDIPLGGECNGQSARNNGVVYFEPNGGKEKIPLTPGTYKYNWVLCSTGKYNTGKATGSAKMVISWD